MANLTLKCQTCGGDMPPIDSESQEGKELLRLMGAGGAEIRHERCPGATDPILTVPRQEGRRFEARVSIVEVIAPTEEGGDASLDELAAFSVYADAHTFAGATRPLALALGEKWQLMERSATIVDVPVIGPGETATHGAPPPQPPVVRP